MTHNFAGKRLSPIIDRVSYPLADFMPGKLRFRDNPVSARFGAATELRFEFYIGTGAVKI
jgi:hypothetical protein